MVGAGACAVDAGGEGGQIVHGDRTLPIISANTSAELRTGHAMDGEVPGQGSAPPQADLLALIHRQGAQGCTANLFRCDVHLAIGLAGVAIQAQAERLLQLARPARQRCGFISFSSSLQPFNALTQWSSKSGAAGKWRLSRNGMAVVTDAKRSLRPG